MKKLFLLIFFGLSQCLMANQVINKGKFLLTEPPCGPGFFSTFRTVLGCLNEYDQQRWESFKIDFGTHGAYYDATIEPNWWNYYFEPISLGNCDGKFEELSKIKKDMLACAALCTPWLSCKRCHELIQKYIKIRPNIEQKINTFVNEKFKNQHVIGIHYRGTDKKSEAPSYEIVVAAVIQEMKLHQDQSIKIFIATDEAAFLTFMQEKFSNQILAYDAIRSFDSEAIHYSNVGSNYKKGEDALIDCILLSKCNYLIKMSSNLSDCSFAFNPHLRTLYLNNNDRLI